MSNSSKVFVAYGSIPPEIGKTIEDAVAIANNYSSEVEYHTWVQNDIVGLDLVQPIVEGIENSSFVVADISSVNNNVIYEIGYAIGCGKRVIITRAAEAPIGIEELNRIGLFDTIGFATYSSSHDLAAIISKNHSGHTIPISFAKNKSRPLYLISCATTNAVSQRILSRLKKTRLNFRSFTPSEDIRLSAAGAIENIVSSLGIVLDWRSEDDATSTRHNTRTAFSAGLAHALKIETIIFAQQGAVIPLDFRNSSIMVGRSEDIDQGIAEFVPNINVAFQESVEHNPTKVNRLTEISLGDSAAENELGDLSRYFLQTATYAAATKGTVKTIVGRKGSGKTALWARIRNKLRSKKASVIVDLKPEGYQLVRLREDVLEHLSFGQKLHLATAFWEYLLMLEIANKIIEKDRTLYARNPRLTEGYIQLSEYISDYNDLGDTDFGERLHKLSTGLAGKLSSDRDVMVGKFNGHDLTNKIYAVDIKGFRKHLFQYLHEKEDTWILFDNLDRGWPVHGLEDVDFVILRALIDASRKLEREFRKQDLKLKSIVFIRDDIYSELVLRTSDFGKEQPQKIDWKDPDQLRELIRLRLSDNRGLNGKTFEDLWKLLFCSHYMGEETSQFLIERSMMRPRNLLNLIGHCRASAINMQHKIIEPEDIEKGMSTYSTDLLEELSREMEDVLPEYNTLLWDFVRSDQKLDINGLHSVFDRAGVPENEHERVIQRLIYYGFIGIVLEEDEKYIYHFNYQIELILANIRRTGKQTLFCIHPAFRQSLTLV